MRRALARERSSTRPGRTSWMLRGRDPRQGREHGAKILEQAEESSNFIRRLDERQNQRYTKGFGKNKRGAPRGKGLKDVRRSAARVGRERRVHP